MKKKTTALLLAAVMTASVGITLTGCGGPTGSGQGNTYQDVIDWENIDWEGKKDSSSEITVYISNDLQDYYAPKIEAFENAYSQYEVDVHWGAAGDGVKSEQTTAISTGNPPDLILGGDVHIENQKGFLLPLNKLIERDESVVKSDDFLDGLLESLQSGEGIYYLPTTFSVSLLMYNKTLFDNAELAYPTADWTFDDFIAAGKALTKYDSGMATQWGNQTITEWWSQWYSMLTTNGGALFNDEGLVTLNNQTAIDTIETWRSLAGVQGKSIGDYPNKIGTHGGSDGGNLGNFAGGKVGMLYSTSAGQLMTFSNAASLNFDIAPLPKSTVTGNRNGTELSITAYGIHKNSKNKKGAWELLKYLTAPRTDLQELADFALPCVRKSERDLQLAVPKAERLTKYKNVEAIYDAVATSKPLPRIAWFEEVTQQYLVPEINKLLDGTHSTVQAALKAAEDNANAYIQYRYKSDF